VKKYVIREVQKYLEKEFAEVWYKETAVGNKPLR
jgi:hypothetical protein